MPSRMSWALGGAYKDNKPILRPVCTYDDTARFLFSPPLLFLHARIRIVSSLLSPASSFGEREKTSSFLDSAGGVGGSRADFPPSPLSRLFANSFQVFVNLGRGKNFKLLMKGLRFPSLPLFLEEKKEAKKGSGEGI